MKINLIIKLLLICGLTYGGYYYYQRNYVDTLMLSEIVGHTDNMGVNIAVDLVDFNTGITRHDINQLQKNKDYWISRIQEVEAIDDTNLKGQASTQLLSEMMEDPVLKKICTGIFKLGTNTSFGLIEMIL